MGAADLVTGLTLRMEYIETGRAVGHLGVKRKSPLTGWSRKFAVGVNRLHSPL